MTETLTTNRNLNTHLHKLKLAILLDLLSLLILQIEIEGKHVVKVFVKSFTRPYKVHGMSQSPVPT